MLYHGSIRFKPSVHAQLGLVDTLEFDIAAGREPAQSSLRHCEEEFEASLLFRDRSFQP